MDIGLLSIELHIAAARSLKDKRMVLRSIKDRLRRLNVSVAELEHQDRWQRAELGIVAIGMSAEGVDRTLAAAVEEIERIEPGLIARTQVEHLA